jgi:hypothetical protein
MLRMAVQQVVRESLSRPVDRLRTPVNLLIVEIVTKLRLAGLWNGQVIVSKYFAAAGPEAEPAFAGA